MRYLIISVAFYGELAILRDAKHPNSDSGYFAPTRGKKTLKHFTTLKVSEDDFLPYYKHRRNTLNCRAACRGEGKEINCFLLTVSLTAAYY